VAAVGSAVTNVREGDKVILHPLVTCGLCRACRSGDDVHCENSRFPGIDSDGGYAEYLLTTARSVVKIDESLEPAAVAARVGMVWQDPDSQLVMERVEDDVAFGLENRGWPRDAMRRRVPEALDEMGLGGLERQPSRRLSGGQQQRLALAGALAPRPDVLVLDEPTANLDPEGAAAFMERLAALRAQRSTTIVLIEHLVEAAWPMADLILALDDAGRAIDVGTPSQVAERSAARLRDAGIWLPAAVERRIASGGPGESGRRKPAPTVEVAAEQPVAALVAADRGASIGNPGSGV